MNQRAIPNKATCARNPWPSPPPAPSAWLSPIAESDTPFGPDVPVFKVAGKLFPPTSPEEYLPRIKLKGEPARAVEMQEEYDVATPGYHMNKRHWNTVLRDGSLPASLVRSMVRDSYDLVVAGLPAAARAALTGKLVRAIRK